MKKRDGMYVPNVRIQCEEICPPMHVDRPMIDGVEAFCAGAIFLIQHGQLRFVYVPYKRDGKGPLQFKLAGGMYKIYETPLTTVKREISEEVGINVKEENLHLVHFVHYEKTEYKPEHIQYFFAATEFHGELKKERFDDKTDETGAPRLADVHWLKENIFHTHKEAFDKAVTFLVGYYNKLGDAHFLLAAVNSKLLEADNRVKGLIRQRAEKDASFAIEAVNSMLVEPDDKIITLLRERAINDSSFALRYANQLDAIIEV